MHIIIFILAFALRFLFLTYNPPSLNWDEVSHGYNAYSILKTGMDEWGQRFPLLNFRAYGDYPTTLNLYLTIPFVAIFGLTEFAIRFPHVILGTLTVVATYYLAFGLTKKRGVALISAFLAAISPWTLFTSRFVAQANVSVFLVTACFAFFFNREKNKVYLPISLGLLFLTLFAYHTTRIFSPLILLTMLFIYKKAVPKFFVVMFLTVAIGILVIPQARVRSLNVSIIDGGAVAKIIELRRKVEIPSGLSRLVFNRPTYFISTFIKNYIGYFTPNFLFIKGGTQYQFSVPNQGLIPWINLPLFYFGLIWLVTKGIRENKNWKLVLIWLLLAPIPASATTEQFAVLRSSAMIPIPFILSAIGVEKILKKKFYVAVYIALSLFILGVYLNNYFTKYRSNYSWAWQYGYKEAVTFAKENYDKYDKIIVTKKYGEPHEFFLFFWPWDPRSLQDDKNVIRFYKSNWWWVDKFDKFYFVNDWQVREMKLESGGDVGCKMKDVRCLLITSPGNFPTGWSKIEEVNFLDGKPAFEIYEN